MKVLVTGATGFIGSHLVKKLVQTEGFDVSIVRRHNSDLSVLGDAQNQVQVYELNNRAENIYEILKSDQPRVVVHLATKFLGSHHRYDIEDLVKSNIEFPTKLLQAMSEAGVPCFINTGTIYEYHNCSSEYDPISLYAATKKAFEDVLQYYIKAHQISSLTLKLFDTYGPDDQRPKLFSVLKQALKSDNPLDISPGHQQLDFTFVDDIVQAFEKAIVFIANQPEGYQESLFVGNGESHTLKDVVKTFEEVVGQNIDCNWGARKYRPIEMMNVHADIRKAKELLNWQPQYSLREGLEKMIKEES